MSHCDFLEMGSITNYSMVHTALRFCNVAVEHSNLIHAKLEGWYHFVINRIASNTILCIMTFVSLLLEVNHCSHASTHKLFISYNS